MSVMAVSQQLLGAAVSNSAVWVTAFEAQVNTEPVLCSLGANVYKHGKYVVATHPRGRKPKNKLSLPDGNKVLNRMVVAA